ncbi:MAG: indole-3-glycerol phosphate synthase TrpC [Victivallaceae bacterium]|nr:indole-3-glycerol phosphate synthase TrpC [Victivallaceae bacterium]
MENVIENILAAARKRVAEQKKVITPDAMARHALAAPRRAGFSASLRLPGIRVIAEIKRASPSKGLIRNDFHPVDLARRLAASGAAALSVLTEPEFFLGSTDFLREAAGAVTTPLLRKDFIFDEYQLLEARAAGASAVLLIAAMLDDREFARLYRFARDLGLEILAEAHSADEVRRLLDAGAAIIGVNARNLADFSTDLDRSAELLAMVPCETLAVAESAIRNAADIARLRQAGAQAFLIGETLMRANDPGEKLCELLK